MIERLVFVRDDFMSVEECNALIEHYKHANNNGLVNEGVISKFGKTTTDSNLKCSSDWQIGRDNQYSQFLSALSKRLNRVIMEEFLSALSANAEFDARCILNGTNTAYSTFQVQKYAADQGHFRSWHIENIGKRMAGRIFSILIYLNTLEEEMKGETEFLLLERKIRPVAGKLLIHPAGYPFVHRGNKPCSSDKYVLISWLEYV